MGLVGRNRGFRVGKLRTFSCNSLGVKNGWMWYLQKDFRRCEGSKENCTIRNPHRVFIWTEPVREPPVLVSPEIGGSR